MTSLTSKFENKIKLNDEDLDHFFLNFHRLPTFNNNDKKIIFVSSLNLYERRNSDDYIEHLKENLKKKGCFEKDVDFIFFPIYDKTSEHFASCILDIKNEVFYYYDSLEEYNMDEAVRLFKNLNMIDLIKDDASFRNPDFYQQRQDWECGYYILYSIWLVILTGGSFKEVEDLDRDVLADIKLMLSYIPETKKEESKKKMSSITPPAKKVIEKKDENGLGEESDKEEEKKTEEHQVKKKKEVVKKAKVEKVAQTPRSEKKN